MGRYTQSIASTAIVASTTRTMIQLVTSANEQAIVVEFGICFDGSTATTPIEVRLARQTTAGTSSAGTPVKWDPADATTPQTTTLTGFSSTEPTTTDILGRWFVAANNGLFVMQYPLGREPKIALSGRLGLITVSPASVTPNCLAYMVYEE